jgi:uncharacterized protein YbjT (DUF2867 family)
MSKKDVIVVLGATGSQGGGLAHAILEDPKSRFAVRAVTRDANSEKARRLAQAGADVVAANVDKPESLRRAFEGAYGAYCVTFYWDHMSPDRERDSAAAMAEAAKKMGLRHVIWSTLEDTRKRVPLSDNRMPTLMGKYKVPHFDVKGESDQFFHDAGVPTTFLLTSFYWDNFINFGMGPRPGADGDLAITFPLGNNKLPGIAAEDIGKCAYAIFQRGGEFFGRTVGIAGEHLTGAEMAAALTKALGEHVNYNAVPPEVYRSFGFPGADDLGNMFQYNAEFEREFCGARDTGFTRSLNPALQTLETWLERNKHRIPLERSAGA